MQRILLTTLCTSLALTSTSAMADDLPSREEMWKMIQMQQKQIEALTKQSQQQNQKLVQTEAKVEATQTKVEKTAKQVQSTEKQMADLKPAAGSGSAVGTNGWWNRTSLGGYGEIHANKGSSIDEVDFHRFILYVGHEFNEDIRLFSEIEVEHADEIFLEQAYLEFDIGEQHAAKVGAFLMPVGILNEVHEPTTFYGVERNPIETNIIPSTWREAGVLFSGRNQSGFSYDLGLHSGLNNNLSTPSNYRPRSGRGKISDQEFEDGAATARVKYTGMPGVSVAAVAHYQQDTDQGQGVDTADATLFEANMDIKKGPFGLRALAARWDINGTGAAALGRDEQYGFYVEPSYKFPLPDGYGDAGVFTRYNQYDNSAGNSADTKVQQIDVGLNYWPHENVVLKADVAFIDNGSGLGRADDEIFNFGAGFVF